MTAPRKLEERRVAAIDIARSVPENVTSQYIPSPIHEDTCGRHGLTASNGSIDRYGEGLHAIRRDAGIRLTAAAPAYGDVNLPELFKTEQLTTVKENNERSDHEHLQERFDVLEQEILEQEILSICTKWQAALESECTMGICLVDRALEDQDQEVEQTAAKISAERSKHNRRTITTRAAREPVSTAVRDYRRVLRNRPASIDGPLQNDQGQCVATIDGMASYSYRKLGKNYAEEIKNARMSAMPRDTGRGTLTETCKHILHSSPSESTSASLMQVTTARGCIMEASVSHNPPHLQWREHYTQDENAHTVPLVMRTLQCLRLYRAQTAEGGSSTNSLECLHSTSRGPVDGLLPFGRKLSELTRTLVDLLQKWSAFHPISPDHRGKDQGRTMIALEKSQASPLLKTLKSNLVEEQMRDEENISQRAINDVGAEQHDGENIQRRASLYVPFDDSSDIWSLPALVAPAYILPNISERPSLEPFMTNAMNETTLDDPFRAGSGTLVDEAMGRVETGGRQHLRVVKTKDPLRLRRLALSNVAREYGLAVPRVQSWREDRMINAGVHHRLGGNDDPPALGVRTRPHVLPPPPFTARIFRAMVEKLAQRPWLAIINGHPIDLARIAAGWLYREASGARLRMVTGISSGMGGRNGCREDEDERTPVGSWPRFPMFTSATLAESASEDDNVRHIGNAKGVGGGSGGAVGTRQFR
ncbi:uncharacterized protein LAESUDRAFT_761686 [Laetiporus sulphureus 93-53]|uniref:Uncharacterized protein n=1 Tax=Laetiporus sulphureus 93-53 TaxID=1314785 RepID=A0A165CZW4_9APHY|nr:uncharacterized protein LAESUDRAFT_761686 [Laetiporus sulphureus 93-53]KZT03850.1 hypothetical protein LAESUDRAFT_761686 [Laetiporus sulphureus 93-53]